MNFQKGTGSIIFALVILAALIGGILTCLVTVLGFAYGGFESIRFNIIAILVALSTLGLALGWLGAWTSQHRAFGVITLLSSACLFLLVGLYVAQLALHTSTPGTAFVWLLPLVLIEGTATFLSIIRLRSSEVTPWPQ